MTYDDAFVKNASTLRVQLDKLSEQAPNGLVETRVEEAYQNLDVAIEAYERTYGGGDDDE